MQRFFFIQVVLIFLIVFSVSAQSPATDGRTNFAVVNLKCGDGVSEGESELITDRLRTELFNTGKVNMMERNQMQEILKEQGFQQSGTCTDEACLVEMGQMLGVKIMVIGSLGKLGSMFMVNIRAIDVQTAQVVKVVSVDIKGDIEEVVDHLAEIANKLTVTEGVAQTASESPPVESAPEPSPAPQPEPAVAPQEEAPPAVEVSNDEQIEKTYEAPEKNRNRSGVGFTFSLFGTPSHTLNLRGFDESSAAQIFVRNTETDSIIRIDDDFTTSAIPIMDLLVRFYIRAGKYLNIEIGPHFSFGNETYSYISDFSFDTAQFSIEYYIPGVHFGLDFVKRINPLKINVGIFGNLSVPLVYYEFAVISDGIINDDYFSKHNTSAFIRFIPGIRTGAEFLVGERLGFAVDFVWQMLRLDLDFDFDEYDLDKYDSNNDDYDQKTIFPSIGIGFSVNLYF